MTDFLRCQICGELVENALRFLHDHIRRHIRNYEEEAEREGEDIDVWVLSYFDSITQSETMKELRNEVEREVERHLVTFFTEYRLPEKAIRDMVDDVFETSAIAEGDLHFNHADISLACQRVLVGALNNNLS
jgi:hypothetical protein